MRIVNGKAVLELQPMMTREASRPRNVGEAVAMFKALWGAHDMISAITVRADGVIRVDVVVPEDHSLNLHTLQQSLEQRVRNALIKHLEMPR